MVTGVELTALLGVAARGHAEGTHSCMCTYTLAAWHMQMAGDRTEVFKPLKCVIVYRKQRQRRNTPFGRRLCLLGQQLASCLVRAQPK